MDKINLKNFSYTVVGMWTGLGVCKIWDSSMMGLTKQTEIFGTLAALSLAGIVLLWVAERK